MGGDANYARWEIVQMNGGLGDQGFYSNDTDGSGMKGLKWNIDYPRTDPGQNNEFQGWLGELIFPLFGLFRSDGFRVKGCSLTLGCLRSMRLVSRPASALLAHLRSDRI